MTTENSHETTVPVESGAEAFVEMLNANEVEHLFINSGTDTFPIQEAIAKFDALGRPTPRVVLCPDEATAVAAAHGHFMTSRKLQVVLVHVDAGTLQLGGNMHDAQRGRAGMVLCSIEPTDDYLAGNGGVRNATRVLSYPVAGDVESLTMLTKRILEELCGIAPEEALDIDYWE